MGTSGAYGGSGSKPWQQVHDAVGNVGKTTKPGKPPSNDTMEIIVDNIWKAIQRQSPGLLQPKPTNYTPKGLVRQRRGGPGVVSSGKGPTRSTGRGLSTRNFARGAATLAAGYAFQAGNEAALADLGLGLTELQALPVTQRCQRILDEILGAPGHLDDEILRRASLEALKEMFSAEGELSGEQSLRTFLAAYVYQTALAELTSQRAAKNLAPEMVLKHEKDLKQYVTKRVKFERVIDGPRLSMKKFINAATDLAGKALGMLGVKTS